MSICTVKYPSFKSFQRLSKGVENKNMTCLVDGNEDELDKEAQDTHSQESNSCKTSDLAKLPPVWLLAPLQQPAKGTASEKCQNEAIDIQVTEHYRDCKHVFMLFT